MSEVAVVTPLPPTPTPTPPLTSPTPSAPTISTANPSTTAALAVAPTSASATTATTALVTTVGVNPAICRYFQRGICRFGAMCRFSHDLSGGEVINAGNDSGINSTTEASTSSAAAQQQPKASTSRHNWANADAPVFVPTYKRTDLQAEQPLPAATTTIIAYSTLLNMTPAQNGDLNKSWAYVVSGGGNGGNGGNGVNENAAIGMKTVAEPGSLDLVCPYEFPCPYGAYCMYSIHLELCKMCDQYCLHPNDQAQRRKHNQECLQQHEQAMELSFAIARSKDKTCGICFDTIMEKSGREKRFGILPNCSHIFCLECIRKWRQAKQFEHKITRSCPECRVSSDFVCPSAFWVETKEEKDKLLNDYRSALGAKDCKYFKKGVGKCPFGNKCFYKHALPNGELVDVGCPKRARKLHRSTNEIIDLLDVYLWEFVDQRDYHWLDMLSSTSDDSDMSDWSDDERAF